MYHLDNGWIKKDGKHIARISDTVDGSELARMIDKVNETDSATIETRIVNIKMQRYARQLYEGISLKQR